MVSQVTKIHSIHLVSFETKTIKAFQYTVHSFIMEDRSHSWLGLVFLSTVNIGAILDEFNYRNGQQNYALATACISLIFGTFYTSSHRIDSLRAKFVGNFIENTTAAVTLVLWAVAIAFIQSPGNEFAVAISAEGKEYIVYANLYFFSWLTFLLTVYLFGSCFQDIFEFSAKLSQWILICTMSIILLTSSIVLNGDICDNDNGNADNEKTCSRMTYATLLGGCGIGISTIAIVLSTIRSMTKTIEFFMVILSALMYFFGVVLLTSSTGPASTIGNMYFAVWGGCFVSCMMALDCTMPGRKDGIESESDGNGGVEVTNP